MWIKFLIKCHILRAEIEDYNEEVVGWMKEDKHGF